MQELKIKLKELIENSLFTELTYANLEEIHYKIYDLLHEYSLDDLRIVVTPNGDNQIYIGPHIDAPVKDKLAWKYLMEY